MDQRVLVINPNSSTTVTQGIRQAILEVPGVERLDVTCVELGKAPPGIETDAHVIEVIPLLCERVRKEAPRRDSFVIACFSDPGIEQLRGVTAAPIVGIGEAAYREASRDGRRFGVISILTESVSRHARHIQRLDLGDALAGDRALKLSVAELSDSEKTRARLEQVCEALLRQDEADALILGCAGMARYRKELQSTFGIPIIEPSQSAIRQLLRGNS